MKRITLDTVSSTNSFLATQAAAEGGAMTVVTAEEQTAGRGQGTNTWESARGQNLLFSIMVHPRRVAAADIWVLSEAIAVSIAEVVARCIDAEGDGHRGGAGATVTVKWPNDIYVGDAKIAGILIETRMSSQRVERAIIGCGVDVNQTEFSFSSPEPTSLALLTGRRWERQTVLEKILAAFRRRYESIEGTTASNSTDTSAATQRIHEEYMSLLYRREGCYGWEDKDGIFSARIADVTRQGQLILEDTSGRRRAYYFKEVSYERRQP